MCQIKSLVYQELLFTLRDLSLFFDKEHKKTRQDETCFSHTKEDLKHFLEVIEVAFQELEYQNVYLNADLPMTRLSFRVLGTIKTIKKFNTCLDKFSDYSVMLAGRLYSLEKNTRTAQIVYDSYMNVLASVSISASFSSLV